MSNSEILPLIDAELSTMPDAAQKLLRLARAEIVRLRADSALLSDPNAVHINMLRGTLAKPTVEQIIHIYGDEIVRLRTPPGEGELARLPQLRKIAEAATPGPWTVTEHGWIASRSPEAPNDFVVDEHRDIPGGWPDSEYIAAFDPPTVLSLIDALLAQAALLGEARKTLAAVIADIDEYERVNDLHPNPGRTECWDSVKAGKALLTKLDAAALAQTEPKVTT